MKTNNKTPKKEAYQLHKKGENMKRREPKPTTKMVKNKQTAYYETHQQTKGGKVVQKDKTNKLLKNMVGVCAGIMFFLVFQFLLLDSNVPTYFTKNTTINGIQVGQLDGEQASKVIGAAFTKKAETFSLTLKHQGKSWSFNKNDFQVNSNIHTIIEEAQAREQANQTYETQKTAVQTITKNGSSIVVAFNYIFVGLDEKIDQIISEIEVKPINSEIHFQPNQVKMFDITKEKHGLKVNKEQLYYDINEQFLNSNLVTVEIPTLIDEASVTYDQNLALTKLVGSYQTNVSDSTGNRKSNVNLALKKVNGLVVEPGQQVSFNKLTAPHTLNNGYKVATIIFNGKFVDGVGGGICQASTTLYNALLLADVQIDQVVKHTLPVKYVPLGLDAMVAEGIADLVFTNTSKYPLFIKTSTNSDSVKVEVFSHELEHGLTLKTRSEIVKKIPHNGDVVKPDTNQEYSDKVLYKGERYRVVAPRDGYEAKSYVDYYKNGQLVTSKVVRQETYYPQQGLVVEGVLEKPTEFNSAEQRVEEVKPNTTSNAFWFQNTPHSDLLETVPTAYCP